MFSLSIHKFVSKGNNKLPSVCINFNICYVYRRTVCVYYCDVIIVYVSCRMTAVLECF